MINLKKTFSRRTLKQMSGFDEEDREKLFTIYMQYQNYIA